MTYRKEALAIIPNGSDNKEKTMPIQWKNHITSTPNILRGKPRLKGTRIPVSLILGYLANGATTADIIADFPDINAQQIHACLDYARELAEAEFPR